MAFSIFSVKAGKPQGGRPSIEYHVTLDMAKELSMVESNHKGREAHRYFIAMERQALADLVAARRLPVEADQHFQRAFQGRAVFFGVENGKLLATTRFLCSFNLDGKTGLHEIPSSAVVIAQDRLAEFIGNHAGAADELGSLPFVPPAVGENLQRIMRGMRPVQGGQCRRHLQSSRPCYIRY